MIATAKEGRRQFEEQMAREREQRHAQRQVTFGWDGDTAPGTSADAGADSRDDTRDDSRDDTRPDTAPDARHTPSVSPASQTSTPSKR
jgi:hypothetical protein